MMVDYRRYFHQYPEVSNKEVNTCTYITRELQKLGLSPQSFTGKDVYGSMLNDTIDPTIIAAQVITQLQTIISHSLHPLENAVISIGELKAGAQHKQRLKQ